METDSYLLFWLRQLTLPKLFAFVVQHESNVYDRVSYMTKHKAHLSIGGEVDQEL